jgi:pyruvate dehydrogenase E2 component (dihydrolipoamide acetyltransferase)
MAELGAPDMIAHTITTRTAPVGIRQGLLARAANLGSIRVSGTDAAPAPAAPAAPPAPAPAPAAPAPAETPQPGEPEADSTKPKKPAEPGADTADADHVPNEADVPADGGPPADPAEVAEVCAAAGQGVRASTFIRAGASMATVRLGLLANGAAIHARFNGQPKPAARPAAAQGGTSRVDAAAIFGRMNGAAGQGR